MAVAGETPTSVGSVYRALGVVPQCGKCVTRMQSIVEASRGTVRTAPKGRSTA
jgi:bacterioferritin-associated ferredoxin